MLKKLLLWPQFKQVAVQLLNYIRNFATPGTAAHQDSLSFTISRNLLKLMPIDSVMPSILFSVILFSYCLQSFPASGTLLMSQFCTSGGQSFGASLSASVILMNIQKDWLVSFRKDRFGLLAVQGTLKSLLQHHSSKHPSVFSLLYGPTLISIHDYWKNHSFDYTNICWQSNVSTF